MADEKNAGKPATETAVAEVSAEQTVLQGRECLKIILLDGNKPYGKGKRQEQGKTYSQFRFGQIVFNVPNDSSFPADHKAGDLKTVSLNNVTVDKEVVDDKGNVTTIGVAGLEFDYHISKTQDRADRMDEFEDKKLDVQIAMFGKMQSQPVTEDFLIKLLQQA